MFRSEHCQRARVVACLGLFPTIHHIGSTPNGVRMYPLLKHLAPGLARLANALARLPGPYLLKAARLRLGPAPSGAMLDEVLALIDGKVARNTTHMARIEMEDINALRDPGQLREQGLERKLLLYLGATDNWLSPEIEADLEENLLPGATVQRDTAGTPHAFMLKTGNPVAEHTWAFVAKMLQARR